MFKTILITGAGSGFGAAAAVGLARNGHNVIATVQCSPQVTPLREKAKTLGLTNLRVEKLDLLDSHDVAFAQSWDIDVLWNNAGMGEGGPVFEIPLDLVRRNYEVNVFLPLALTQHFVRKWITQKKRAKVVFTSSMSGLFSPANWGVYASTKHALEAVAEAMQQELAGYGIKVQTINPGAFTPALTRPWPIRHSAGSTMRITSPGALICAHSSTRRWPHLWATSTRRR